MSSIEITQSVSQISKLFHLALNGEEIIITKKQQPLLKLISLQPKSKRPHYLVQIKKSFPSLMILMRP